MRYIEWLAAHGWPIAYENLDEQWWDLDSNEEPFVQLVNCLLLLGARDGERRFRMMPPVQVRLSMSEDGVEAGEYVGLRMVTSVSVGRGEWKPGKSAGGIFTEFPGLDQVLTDAKVRFASCTDDSAVGSVVTVFFRRLPQASGLVIASS